jgi:outer membrane protein OmpA-like peptidoglycan-associated protein
MRSLARLLGVVPIAAATTCSLWASRASADECTPSSGISTCVDADNLWARPGSSPFLSVAGTATTASGEIAVGGVVSYLSRPLRLQFQGPDVEPREAAALDNMLDVTFLFALGVTDRLELTLAAPVTFYQDGAGTTTLSGSETGLPRSTIRDPRFGLAYAFVARPRAADSQGFGLSGRFDVGAPLGDGDAFAGGHTASFAPSVAADYAIDRFLIGAEVGGRIRGAQPLGAVTWGSQLYTSAGVSALILRELRLSTAVEAFALVTLEARAEDAAMLAPAEWLHSVRIAPLLAGDLAFSLYGGGPIPLTDQAATAPRFRFGATISYAPQGLDSDGDGVLDRDDGCTTVAEDRDGFQDADGCPEPDNDGDRIPDVRDRCRDAAETVDGFQDDDGCPDLDDDADGIPDELDQCRNDAEDKDGFEDDDGCPDPDNDQDGVPDARDTCPTTAEDKDGVRDGDGCPDPDDDADGVPDVDDQCKDQVEDKDGFQDEDGCPEPDNDQDGVLDRADKCPTEAETLDGTADDDGCPEAGARSLVALRPDGHVTMVGAPRFRPGSATPTPELEKALRLAARLLRGAPGAGVVIVEAFGDKPKNASAAAEQLAVSRASRVRAILVEEGVAEARITAASGDLAADRSASEPQVDVWVQRGR